MKSLRDYYDQYWAGNGADPDADPTTPARREALLRSLVDFGVKPGSRVLDVGCGDGTFCRWLADAGYEPAGVDISAKALDRARCNATSADLRLLNEDSSIPFGNSEFQAVWSTEVIEHVFAVHRYLSEINRVVVGGGLYILTTPFHGVVKNIIVSILKFNRHFDPEGPHIRFFDKEGLHRCLTKAGFTPLQWRGIGRMWPLRRTWFTVCRKTGTPKAP